MREKIMNIKNVLKIIIMVFIIFSCIKACANAKTLTTNDIKNFICNYAYYRNNNADIQALKQDLDSKESIWQDWVDKASQYQGRYYIGCYSGQVTFICYTGSTSNLNTYAPYYYNTSNSWQILTNSSYLTNYMYYYRVTDYSTSGSWQTNKACNIGNPNYFYTDADVYTNSKKSNGTIKFAAGSSNPSNVFAENYYTDIKWELIPNSNNTITIPNREETFYTLNKGTFNTTLATLQDSVYTEQIWIIMKAYNGTTWEKVTDRIIFNDETQLMVNTFPSVTENDILKSQIQLKSNTIPTNVIIQLEVYPDYYFQEQLNLEEELIQYYYITDNNTIITSGTLDIIATFSGDNGEYANEVNQAINNEQTNTNDSNLQEITNQINENNNWWKLQFNNLFTLDSGDTEDIKNQIAEKINFEEVAGISGELAIIDGIQNAEVGDFIISWQPAIYEDKIIIPSGEINFSAKVRETEALQTIHRYSQTILCAAVAFLILHRIWKTLCILIGVGTQVYEDYEDEHGVVEGQNTLYDVDTGVTTYQQWNRQGQNLNIVKHSTGGKKKRK